MRIYRHAIKKSIALSLIVVTFISALFLPSCGDAHTHEWSEWEVYIEPSCFVAGQEKSECSCGKVKYREIPTSHKYELKEMRIEDRRAIYECPLCGNEENRALTSEILGVPIVSFNGSLSGISHDDRVTVTVDYDGPNGSFSAKGSIKYQGATSLRYDKKNYSLKFKTDDGEKLKVKILDEWGSHSKYCLKANYIDVSQLRNVVSAKLYGDVARTGERVGDNASLVNGGAIDGFPVALYINGKFAGLYTFNTPKDEYVIGLNDKNAKQAFIVAESFTNGTMLEEPVTESFEKSGFELAYCSTENIPSIGDSWVTESFNRMVEFLNSSSDAEFRAHISEYVDVDRAIDEMLFTYAIGGSDNTSKSIIWATFDGDVWVPFPYDLDSTWGLYWNGEEFFEAGSVSPQKMNNVLWQRLGKVFGREVAERWFELRESALGIENVEKRFKDFDEAFPAELRAAERARWSKVPNGNVDYMKQITSFAEKNFEILDGYYSNFLNR